MYSCTSANFEGAEKKEEKKKKKKLGLHATQIKLSSDAGLYFSLFQDR